MWKHRYGGLALAVTLAMAGLAWACGPEFPSQLLDHRDTTLKAVPQNSFDWEAQHLLVATDALQAHESAYFDPKSAEAAKAQGLTAAQLQQVTALRQSADSDKAYADGKDLPEDLRLYVAGAVDYAAALRARHCADGDAGQAACGSPDQQKMDRAVARFEKVLALPSEQARLRGVWAAYMLGSIHALRSDASVQDQPAFKREREAAAKAFQQVRTLAVAGAADPQGLAVASFGEEARLYLYNGEHQCSWSELYDSSKDCGTGIAVPDLKHAIALYAAQAGHGSNSGVCSLSALASNVLRDNDRVAKLIDGPVSQRLLVAYVLAEVDGAPPASSATAATPPAQPGPLSALVQAIEQQGVDRVAGSDRLAALAYKAGRYDLAATLAARSPGPLASWVDAKLALQKGDLAAAAAAYADAAKAFPQASDPKAAAEPANTELIKGEQGVLALARGEYVEAMGHLYDAALKTGGDGNIYDEDTDSGAGYGNDAAYVAERVLTLDELKAFVDAHVVASPPPAKAVDKDVYVARPLADNLRWLLARRLMRAERYDEAQDYFPASGDTRFGTVDLRAKARDYANAIHAAGHAWTDIGKAEELYAAAVISRRNGMELFGYEQGPDYTNVDGDFVGGSGHSANDLKQTYVTDGERQRFAESAAKPDIRLHYRYIAADQASAAADLLPPRSQAFGAVLCKAAHWMTQGPPADYDDWYAADAAAKPPQSSERDRRATAYYQRYLKQGAYMRWASAFGGTCEEPDFDRARRLLRHQRMVELRHFVRHHLLYEVIAGVLLLGALIGWLRRRRRGSIAAK